MTKRSAERAAPSLDYVLPAIGAANLLCVAIAALIVVPSFSPMYEGFGAEMPNISQLFLATYRGWAIFALAVPAVWLLWPNPRTRGVAGLLVGTALALLLVAFGVWALYAPIFALAAVTG